MPAWRRMAMVLATLALGGGLIGCAADDPVTLEPLPHNLAEPWQPEPFAISESIVQRAARACGQPGQNLRLTAVDARGESTVMLTFAGPVEKADCLVRLDAGARDSAMGGSSVGGPLMPPQPGAVVVESYGEGGSFGDGHVTTLMGQAGPGVARVGITLSSGRSLRASLAATGWWAAWWPSGDAYEVVTAYDALGLVVSETK